VRERASIAVIDFGGQYAHLIAKRVRHLGCYTIILSPDATAEELAGLKGIILSGGPASVTDANAPAWNRAILEQPVPTLGLCYGHQLMGHALGGTVGKAGKGEYGLAHLEVRGKSPLFAGLGAQEQVWMSHGDSVLALPPGFTLLARTKDCPVAAMASLSRPLFGLQFHPEVKDTPCGNAIFESFLALCGAPRTWSMQAFLAQEIDDVRTQVQDRNVLFFLSGGVDSSVAYALLVRALGAARVLGLYIDHGFMRHEETAQIRASYEKLGWNVKYEDASAEFLAATRGVSDPQEKRARIGQQFIDTRTRILGELDLAHDDWLLGQGTLYPDIIESGGTKHADTIKTHHNRIRGIEELIEAGRVVEPLRDLYKDEVRTLGEELGLPSSIVWRHPFPGPGLAINVLCSEHDAGPLALPREREIKAFCRDRGYEAWVLPVRSVGVQGDQRSYSPPVAVRGPRDWAALESLSTDLTNTFREVNRVVLLLWPDAPAVTVHEAFLTRERLDVVRAADRIMLAALEKHGLTRAVFQHLTIALPLSGAGKEGIVLRPVFSEDVMTARFATLPWALIDEVAAALKAIPAVCAAFYDVTHKPPATFGWE
jgi:GMP synthase (glutamine-hydrolysing)